jgi:hypothetical protein
VAVGFDNYSQDSIPLLPNSPALPPRGGRAGELGDEWRAVVVFKRFFHRHRAGGVGGTKIIRPNLAPIRW